MLLKISFDSKRNLSAYIRAFSKFWVPGARTHRPAIQGLSPWEP